VKTRFQFPALLLLSLLAANASARASSDLDALESELRAVQAESSIFTQAADLESLFSVEPKVPLSRLRETYEFLTEKSKFKGKPTLEFVRARIAAIKQIGNETKLTASQAFALVKKDRPPKDVYSSDDLLREGRLVVLRIMAKRALRAGKADPAWYLVAGEAAFQLTRTGYSDFAEYIKAVKASGAKVPEADLELAKERENELRGSEFPSR